MSAPVAPTAATPLSTGPAPPPTTPHAASGALCRGGVAFGGRSIAGEHGTLLRRIRRVG